MQLRVPFAWDRDAREVAGLVGLQTVGTVIVFGLIEILNRALGGVSGTLAGLLYLILAIAGSCIMPAMVYAHFRRRRDPLALPFDRCAALARSAMRVHIMIVYASVVGAIALDAWEDFPVFLLIATIFIVPSAVVAYFSTRSGLRYGHMSGSSGFRTDRLE